MKENAAAPSDQLTVFTKAVLGSVAATAEALINNPLAVIKTRMQSNRPFTLKPSILMSGVGLNAVGMAPMVATQVTIDDLIKKWLSKKTGKTSQKQRLFSGFLGGFFSAAVVTPTEVVFTLLQQEGVKQNSIQLTRMLLKQNQGVRHLFTGFFETGLRIAVPAAGFLAGVPILAEQLKERKTNSFLAWFVAGTSVGISTALVTQPLDTVKTERQRHLKPKSTLGTIVEIYSKRGVYGFFVGGLPRIIRVTSAVAVMGSLNEKLKSLLTQQT